jgi:hypothetical protein
MPLMLRVNFTDSTSKDYEADGLMAGVASLVGLIVLCRKPTAPGAPARLVAYVPIDLVYDIEDLSADQKLIEASVVWDGPEAI